MTSTLTISIQKTGQRGGMNELGRILKLKSVNIFFALG